MAKAQFSKNQRVWVESVGAWALVERIIPVWTKGFDEPVRIAYDVGLGREFTAQELRAAAPTDTSGDRWRLLRARNKWQAPSDCPHHPHPGTFPVVVTDTHDWGGWRTPGAEYDRDPERIEHQARLIVAAPQLLTLVRTLVEMVTEYGEDAPAELQGLAQSATQIVREVADQPPAARPNPTRESTNQAPRVSAAQ